MRERKIINGWVVHAPLWRTLPNSVKWHSLCGTMLYLNGSVERVRFDYPETAEHFYYLRENHSPFYYSDIFFASYSIEEMRAFIKNMPWLYAYKQIGLYVYDAPTKTVYKGKDFIENFMPKRSTEGVPI